MTGFPKGASLIEALEQSIRAGAVKTVGSTDDLDLVSSIASVAIDLAETHGAPEKTVQDLRTMIRDIKSKGTR